MNKEKLRNRIWKSSQKIKEKLQKSFNFWSFFDGVIIIVVRLSGILNGYTVSTFRIASYVEKWKLDNYSPCMLLIE